ncbi:type II secretion system F family protein [Desemzia sp. RIT804]|uniref:competence type IV pilus assembly protein ComGB n=1 Tax=Desemzia sp. RIT 804 TaxID=2810209 RepID=UPI0019502F01|nr:competence type IV pilus assembly protein ComGB [Desemzia sp. RIT 804]MBM6613353.1 type II secretion system F family protein [Desemzia sp. RIT 804]
MDTSVKKTFKNTRFLKSKQTTIQASFLIKLSTLISEGFALKEALQFLATIMPKEAHWISAILTGLERGNRFDEMLKQLDFSERITAQIYLSLVHGRFAEALRTGGKYLEEKSKQEKQLLKLLQYPVLLLGFMTGVVLVIRTILLPNLMQLGIGSSKEQSLAAFLSITFVQYFPYLVGAVFLGGSILMAFFYYRLGKQTAIKKAMTLTAIPFFGKLIRLHYTHYFSYEWSQLFKSGLQLNEMISLMQTSSTTTLMQEVAEKIEQSLMEGKNFKESMNELPFFNEELGLIVLHGEATSQLGSELALYSKDCKQRFTGAIEKSFSYIQPIIFIVIALIILCVYLALLLPMYSLFEEGMF